MNPEWWDSETLYHVFLGDVYVAACVLVSVPSWVSFSEAVSPNESVPKTPCCIYFSSIGVSNQEWFCNSGHLATSGDIFGCPAGGEEGGMWYWHVVGGSPGCCSQSTVKDGPHHGGWLSPRKSDETAFAWETQSVGLSLCLSLRTCPFIHLSSTFPIYVSIIYLICHHHHHHLAIIYLLSTDVSISHLSSIYVSCMSCICLQSIFII